MKLQEITTGLSLSGVEPTQIVNVVTTVPLGNGALQLIYRTPEGAIKERLLNSADEATIGLAVAERPFSFDGNAANFQLTCEAKRIDLAFLFDPMMAVHTSNIDPLPHQITGVYEAMLPRQPLRFVLADDPGAGKTIMAGLYMRELIMRADARRILVVAPGSLVEQWRDEMLEKFGLEFFVYSPLLEQASPSGNPFEDHNQLIVRLDQLARNDDLQGKLCIAGWDLVVFDEAHKLAAHYFGAKLEKTGRFRFAEKLGAHTRHLLLMTATPHNGKEEDYQLFLSLLDSDRFYGKFRDGVRKVDASDLMRRMVKEELVKFDGTPLFPERRAYTVNYELSKIEAALYEAVTDYVKAEMGKADELEKAVVVSGRDRKWDELSTILQSNPEMHDASGRQRKLIIFSEHLDTLNYLRQRIAGVLGNADAIVTIHGGTHRYERRRLQAVFWSDPAVRVLVATDAAGEGVNLQNANLMVIMTCRGIRTALNNALAASTASTSRR